MAGEPPLTLSLTVRAIRWRIGQGMPIHYWMHLQPLTHDKIVANADTLTVKWREETTAAWDRSWQNHKKSWWTHWLFPKVQARLNPPFEPSFWRSQAMTGHGVFGAYLHSRKLKTTM